MLRRLWRVHIQSVAECKTLYGQLSQAKSSYDSILGRPLGLGEENIGQVDMQLTRKHHRTVIWNARPSCCLYGCCHPVLRHEHIANQVIWGNGCTGRRNMSGTDLEKLTCGVVMKQLRKANTMMHYSRCLRQHAEPENRKAKDSIEPRSTSRHILQIDRTRRLST